jgi:sortase A
LKKTKLNKIKMMLGIACLFLTILLWGNSIYIHLKASFAQVLIEDAWQDALKGKQHPPWAWADTHPVARLHHIKTGNSLFVLSGGHGTALAFGPGHISGTALPGGIGTSVIAGHRDTHFAFLEKVDIGEGLRVQSLNGKWSEFLVTDITIKDTRISDIWYIDPKPNRLVLVTCYPFNAIDPGGPLRMIVSLDEVLETKSS